MSSGKVRPIGFTLGKATKSRTRRVVSSMRHLLGTLRQSGHHENNRASDAKQRPNGNCRRSSQFHITTTLFIFWGRLMKIHEYQAKELLAAAGAIVPRGIVASSPAEAQSAFDRMGGPVV